MGTGKEADLAACGAVAFPACSASDVQAVIQLGLLWGVLSNMQHCPGGSAATLKTPLHQLNVLDGHCSC